MMRFCKSCNNMLYPRENRVNKTLEYSCRPPCLYVERNIDSSCVFINQLIRDSTTRLEVIPSDVNKDPTLQRTKDAYCAVCSHNEAVFFLAEQTSKSTALVLVYVCCKCGHKWMDTSATSNS
eukprot:gene21517-27862_t